MIYIMSVVGIGLFLLGLKCLVGLVSHIELRRYDLDHQQNVMVFFIAGLLLALISQSSSAVGVMGLVLHDKKVITLRQVAFFIAGSNIGTTMTGQILSLNIEKVILPLAGLSVLFFVISQVTSHYTRITKVMLAITLILVGFLLINNTVLFFRDDISLLVTEQNTLLKGFLVGVIATAFCQSSSMMIGILIALAEHSIVTTTYAVAVVLGLNVGTSTTFLMASVVMTKRGQRGAVFQLVYNSISSLLIFSILPLFVRIVGLMSTTNRQFVAHAHTLFNVAAVVLLILGWNLLEKMIAWIVGEA